MTGLMVEEGDVSGAIAGFITENGYYATVQTEYPDHPIYVQKLMCRLHLSGHDLTIKEVGTSVTIGSVDLSDPTSLDHLLELLKQWDGFRRKNPLLNRY